MRVNLVSVLLICVTLLGFPQGQGSKKLAALKVLHGGRAAYDKLVISVRDGALLGLRECRSHFRLRKWNCTIVFETKELAKSPVFIMSSIPHATRETAFAHSISAAGVTYTLTKDCRMGKFKDCSCVHEKSQETKGNWWGGCNENIKFGEVMAKHFLEALEKGNEERTLLRVHNNEVGRKAVRATLKRECRCHGITGSCTTRTCWRKLSSFAEVGHFLMEKYENAKRARFRKDNLIVTSPLGEKILSKKDHSLIYTEPSPDYCRRNMTVGAAGVLGRECEGNKEELAKCGQLCECCDLHAEEFNETKSVYCNCKFQWCCKVKCTTCKETLKKTRCVAKQRALATIAD